MDDINSISSPRRGKAVYLLKDMIFLVSREKNCVKKYSLRVCHGQDADCSSAQPHDMGAQKIGGYLDLEQK